MTMASAALTISVGTAAGWPAVEPCVRSFLADARATGSQVLIADGSGRPPPTDPDILETVTWRSLDDKSVFRLVQSNLAIASGSIVALMEDHCTARPGWVAGILRAHAENPEPAAVGGAIENGTTASSLEWASYLMTQGAHMAPLRNGPATRIANEANISFRRSALEGLLGDPMGFMTIRATRALADRGELLVNDDRIVVDHYERLGARATAVIHFDDGRTISGWRRPSMTRTDWLRVFGAPILPLYRTGRVIRNGVAKGRARTLATALPWIVALEYCHEAGELAGYLAGPGRSPYGLR
jgi:hypothetical protein